MLRLLRLSLSPGHEPKSMYLLYAQHTAEVQQVLSLDHPAGPLGFIVPQLRHIQRWISTPCTTLVHD